MKKIYTTTNYKQTQKLGEELAKEIIKNGLNNNAVVLSLKGNLGGGKTTFLQGFANGLKIKEKILSPTFVIQKKFKIKNLEFKNFYHIDYYRLGDKKDILDSDFKEIISNPENIVAIEWPERIIKLLPKGALKIEFKFIDKNKREIKIKL